MNHLSDLMRQAEQLEAHGRLTSTVSGPAPDGPVMRSMREVDAQQPMLPLLPPPAALQTGQNTVPVLAVGMKRSATDADLDADAIPDGKRFKVSHGTASDAEQRQEAQSEPPGLVTGRKRSAPDATLDEDDMPPAKRLRLGEPWSMRDLVKTKIELPPQIQIPARDTSVSDFFRTRKMRLLARLEHRPVKVSQHYQNALVGDLLGVQVWLKLPGIDINARDENGLTLLTVAVWGGSVEIVQALLAMPGIDVNVQNTGGRNVLSAASHDCMKGEGFSVDKALFTALRIDRKGSGNEGYTVLIASVWRGSVEIVQALLAVPELDLNAWGYGGETALLAAIYGNHHQIALILAAMPGLDVNARIDSNYNQSQYDIKNPRSTEILTLAKATALIFAAELNNLAIVRTLIAVATIDANLKNSGGHTALMRAAHQGHVEIFRALLAMPGIDIEASSSFCYGYDNFRPDFYTENARLFDPGEQSSPRYSALSLAKMDNRTQIVKTLLAMPVSPGFVHRKLHISLGGISSHSIPKPPKKSSPSAEETFCFLRRISHPVRDAATLTPHHEPINPLQASWLQKNCMAIRLGTCVATDVPFLLQSAMPLPAWCRSVLVDAVALGFTTGLYCSGSNPFWQFTREIKTWFADRAFGAKPSRWNAIDLDAGIVYQLDSMGLWNDFINALEVSRLLKEDPDGVQLEKLTLLGCAARDGDLPMIKVLLALGASLHLRSPNGDVPIVAAAKAGQWAACAELVSLGAMPAMVDNKGCSALYYIATAFACADTATTGLACLIRYLRLKNIRFDAPAHRPDEVPVSYRNKEERKRLRPRIADILVSNPESWVRFGKIIYGIDDDALSEASTAAVPALQAGPSRTLVHALLRSANVETALAAWLDENPQHLHWRDPDNDQTLLHLAVADQNIGLVQLLLDRGIARTHVDRAGQTAAHFLPADYMSSYTPAAKRIAALLR